MIRITTPKAISEWIRVIRTKVAGFVPNLYYYLKILLELAA
jgi:hypothetical protein